MKRMKAIARAVVISAALSAAAAAMAGGYEITRFTIDGGGGELAGGAYILTGTVGQWDAAAPAAGGAYELKGGFWVFEAPATTCPQDLNGDGVVNSTDLAMLLGDWGLSDTPADFDGGGVGASDLAAMLGSWGPCP